MRLHKRLSAVLAMSMILTSTVTTSVIAETVKSDIDGHWAEETFNEWIERGDLKGDGTGNYNPSGQITKGEFVTMLTNLVNIGEVPDVTIADSKPEDWHYEAICKAIAMGCMTLDENEAFNPSELIQRDDVAKAIDAVMNYVDSASTATDGFADTEGMTDEMVSVFNNLLEKQLFIGDGDKLNPEKPITRAEVLLVLTRLTGDLVKEAGTYTEDVDRNLTILKAGVTLKNMTINGDLYLTEGITSGDIILDGVTVTGDIYVNMAKDSKVIIKNSKTNNVVISSISGDSIVEVSGESSIMYTYINSGCKLSQTSDVTNSIFEKVIINEVPKSEEVIIDAKVRSLDATKITTNTKIKLSDKGSVDNEYLGDNVTIEDMKDKPSGGGGSSSSGSSSGGSSTEDSDDNKDEQLFASFEDGIPEFVSVSEATMELIESDATEGSKALKVVYKEGKYPSVKFIPKKGTTWDFGENKALAFDVYNTTDDIIMLHTKMEAKDKVTGNVIETVNKVTIQPGEKASMFTGYSEDSLDLGMRGLPPHPAGKNLEYGWGAKSLDLTQVVGFQFWLYGNDSGEKAVIYDNIRFINDPNVDLSYTNDTVDEYGQYTGKDWSGKITCDADFETQKNNEAEDLANGKPEYMSKYGGWAQGEKIEATGRFRVEEHEGRWTMVDPEGYLFFASGVDCVRFDDTSTWIDGRNDMFMNLPSEDGPLGDHFAEVGKVARPPLGLEEGRTFNFYTANLERKYGEEYAEAWRDVTVDRFKNWGFSSIGNWSDPKMFFGKGEETQMPYSANAWINGSHVMLESGNEFAPQIADPFDPEFRASANKSFSDIAEYGVDEDEWCMGIYVDNEIAWGNPNTDAEHYASIVNTLKDDAENEDSYAKRAFITKLKEIHGSDIASLNNKWGTNIASWEELSKPYTIAKLNAGVVNDLSILLNYLADQYYRVVDEELEKVLPNTLNLGSRFAVWGTSMEVQKACAKYVDIVSYNVYYDDINQDWIYAEDLGKPCIVGEFQFGSKDRGMFSGGMISAIDQKDRGDKYEHYMREVANNDYFVGAHWFQYTDQPLTGRAWDGENYNSGFVDGTDTPYPELVASAKEVHSQIYDIRFNKIAVKSISLDKTTLELSKDANTAKLTATIKPSDATFKDVIWSTSDDKVATVDAEGNVEGLANGTVIITATSKDDDSIKATCEVTVSGYKDIICDFENIMFKDFTLNDDIKDWVIPQTGATASIEKGKGLVVTTVYDTNWGGKDAFSKAVEIYPQSQSKTWSFGAEPTLKVKITNPHDKPLKIGMNINDKVPAHQKQQYLDLLPGETKEITANDWAGGFVTSEVTMVMFYIIEPNATSITNNTFIIESIVVEDESKVKNPESLVVTDFDKIVFAKDKIGEGYECLCQEGAKYEITTTSGALATTQAGLFIPADTRGDYYPQTFYQNNGVWNFRENPEFEIDLHDPQFKLEVYNPGSEWLHLTVRVGSDSELGVIEQEIIILPKSTGTSYIYIWGEVDLDKVKFISIRPSDTESGTKQFTIISMEVGEWIQ